jgi:benzil reductase ((S)-benzoin forming)
MAQSFKRMAVVTGTSSGIGLAVALILLQRGWRVVGVSRRPGQIENPNYSHLRLDLGKTAEAIAEIDARVGSLLSEPAIERLALVNNAALGGLLGPVEQLDTAALLSVYAVNVVAPMALMGWLLRRGPSRATIRIVNVSSGAAGQALPGLAAYGSSKAALRMAGMVLGAELDASLKEGGPRRDASILSFEPGLVDTEMQAAARTSSREVLPMVDYFKHAATAGSLMPAAVPARTIADYVGGDGHPTFAERRQAPAPGANPPPAPGIPSN